jgi:hypothetical protein
MHLMIVSMDLIGAWMLDQYRRTSVNLTSEHGFALFAYSSIVSLDEELS